jgi:hypothetical protein
VCADTQQAVLDALDALDLPPGDEVAARAAAVPDALVTAFPAAGDCTEVTEPKPVRVRARWCHDATSSVHYTQWTTWQAMDANYRAQILSPVTDLRDDLTAGWVELTRAEGQSWEAKLAVWYADEEAPYSVTVYAHTRAAASRVLRSLDLRPVAEVTGIPRG